MNCRKKEKASTDKILNLLVVFFVILFKLTWSLILVDHSN